MSDKRYRQDINGMRALAVLGVVAFHFKLGPLRPGGFAGVDVFFVISGFLMVQIITGRLDRGSFSLRDFFEARIRRIVPAFVAMVVGVLIAGFLLLNPLVYEKLAWRALWTLPFLSNWLFATQNTYFNAPDQNWLLHSWSLSVEAQFYFALPLILMALRTYGVQRRVEIAALIVLLLASLAFMLWSVVNGSESRSFYMPWSRLWEFLAGGLCAYAPPRLWLGSRGRLALHYGGLAAIIVTMLVIHMPTPWPSAATMLPVAGAASLLLAGHTEPGWAKFAPIARLGVWSYSIYLWHWPIAAGLSFFGYYALAWRLGGVAASLLLGVASYRLIECDLTDFLWRARRRPWTIGTSAFALALAVSVTASAAPDRIEALRYASRPELLDRLKDFRLASNDDSYHCDDIVKRSRFIEECRFGPSSADDTLVVGDSFAAELMPRYSYVLFKGRQGVAFVVAAGCAPLSKTRRIDSAFACDKWQDELYPYIFASRFKRVVFVDMWTAHEKGSLCLMTEANCGLDLGPTAYAVALDRAYARLADLWKALRTQGRDVVVFETVPYPGESGGPLRLYDRVAAGEAVEQVDFSYADFAAKNAAASARLRMAAGNAGVRLVAPASSMCPDGQCPVVRKGRPLYLDPYHLRASMMKDPRFSIFDRYILADSSAPTGPK